VRRLKLFFIIIFLAGGLLTLIIFIDILMGVNRHGMIWSAMNPFRVMEPVEYLIIFLFIIVFFIKSLGTYIKKKRKSQSPTN